MRTNQGKEIGRRLAALAVAAAAVFPLLFLVVQSLARDWRFPALWPAATSWRAWSYLFDSSAQVGAALANSLLLAAVACAAALVAALPAARALALYEFKGKTFFLFLLLLPALAPSIAAAAGAQAFFLRLGLIDSWPGVVLAHLVPTVPYAVLTLTGSFSRFDADLEAQARSLGANRFQVWRFVTLPAIAPGILTTAVFAFLISWSQYLSTLLVGGGRIVTLPMLLIGFQTGSDEAVTAALTIVFLAPTIVFIALASALWRED